jgi:hypothetical protein
MTQPRAALATKIVLKFIDASPTKPSPPRGAEL